MPRDLSHYDRRYFDKWYRHPRHRVKTKEDMTRQLGFVVSVTEYLLERRLRTVLDVGCGEGNWAPVLHALRPRAKYVGVDGSEYAVKRFGKRRNIRLGSLGTIGSIGLKGPFDLILCLGVLNYVAEDELRRGLRQLHGLAGGVAYLEIFTRADDASGDFRRSAARWPAWYRTLIRRSGFVPLGLHCYLPRDLAFHAAALERADTGKRA
jgi:SAM-dependent methyltransferase